MPEDPPNDDAADRPSLRPPSLRAPGERIEPVEPPYDPEVAIELTKLMPPGVPPLRLFRVLANNPRLLGRIRRGGLLDEGAISVRHRELMILRTTGLSGAEYEWGVHVMFFAQAAELTERQLHATVHEGSKAQVGWSDRDRVVLKLADELHANDRPMDKTFVMARALFDEAAILELIVLAGQYRGISYLVNTLNLPLEPNAPRFPLK